MSHESHKAAAIQHGKYNPPKQNQSHPKSVVRSYSDEELALLVDHWIELWDENQDGYITYYEFRTMPRINEQNSIEEDVDEDGMI